MLKRYFWLAYVLLVTVAAVTAADIATGYVTMRLSEPSVQPSARVGTTAAPVPRQMRLADYAIISERNLFNANPPSGDAARALEVEAEVQPTQLRLRLIGIVTGELPQQQYAVIEDLQRGGAQDLYQIGDVVQRAAILDIRPECVLLDTHRQREKLCFDYDDARDTNGRHGRPARARQREARSDSAAPSDAPADDGVVRIDQGTWQVRRDLITEQFADLGTLSRQVRVTQHTIQGKPSGFRLTRLRPGLLQRIGLSNGDVLQRVNGLDINSPEEALKAYQAIQSEPTVRLEILRRNSPTTLTYEIR
jgi:general secretion pathway protein C